MTTIRPTSAHSGALNSTPAGASQGVEFALVMHPASLAEELFGPELSSLAVDGATPHPAGVLNGFDGPTDLSEIQVLITGWGAPLITDADLDRMPQLHTILHAGGQASSLLPPSVTERGISLSNAGWANGIPVAEYTVATIVLANKFAFAAQRMYRERRAFIDREREFPQSGNIGRVVGVVGASRIGRLVLERLMAFDLDVQVYDPYLDADEAFTLGARLVDLDELMRTSDVVTLHPPLNSETKGMITRRHLGLLRDGSTLINTSRGLIIDQAALTDELETGRIHGIIDVTSPEVSAPDSPLFDLPNVFLTPHIAGSMGHEIRRVGDQIAAELERTVLGVPLAFPETFR